MILCAMKMFDVRCLFCDDIQGRLKGVLQAALVNRDGCLPLVSFAKSARLTQGNCHIWTKIFPHRLHMAAGDMIIRHVILESE